MTGFFHTLFRENDGKRTHGSICNWTGITYDVPRLRAVGRPHGRRVALSRPAALPGARRGGARAFAPCVCAGSRAAPPPGGRNARRPCARPSAPEERRLPAGYPPRRPGLRNGRARGMVAAAPRRRSSVVERALGKGEVECSIHSGGTIPARPGLRRPRPLRREARRPAGRRRAHAPVTCATAREAGGAGAAKAVPPAKARRPRGGYSPRAARTEAAARRSASDETQGSPCSAGELEAAGPPGDGPAGCLGEQPHADR